jgi:transcriptional regulator NrdR family protein
MPKRGTVNRILHVARTYAKGDRVVRHRRCPKCGSYVTTIELFETELSKIKNDLHDAKHQETLEKYALKRELDDLKGAARTLYKAATED